MTQREILKPQMNVPLTVHLDQGPEGKEKTGQYGTDYQYTVNQNAGVMWLPAEGRDALIQSGAQAGDDVQIVKSMRGKQVVWSAQVVSDAAEVPAASNGVQVSYTSGVKFPARVYAQPAQAPVAAPRTAPAPRPAPQPQPETRITPVAMQLASCFCAAIDACLEAETYAKSKGLAIEFNAEDLRAVALSVYIGAQRQQAGAQR